ncbi:heavy metal transporter [Aquimarina sp. 2201CG1-2-11]|uniref:heavy metal transporter n=1 Tax=Aquimarina discodermiae TaxID=3231043 RepID=UPI0034631DCB
MFRNTIPIKNLKCINCAMVLKNKILQLKNISNVFIHKDYSYISFNYKYANDLSNVENLLTYMGFPPEDEKNMRVNIEGLHCTNQSTRYCVYIQ